MVACDAMRRRRVGTVSPIAARRGDSHTAVASATVAAAVATTTVGGGVAQLFGVGGPQPRHHVPRAGVPTAFRSAGRAAATAADRFGPLMACPAVGCRPATWTRWVIPSGGHRAGGGGVWGGATAARPPVDVCSAPWRISRVGPPLRAQRPASAPVAPSCPGHRYGRAALTVETDNSNWTLAAFCVAGVAAACSMVTHERLFFNLTARAVSLSLVMRFKSIGSPWRRRCVWTPASMQKCW